VEAHYFELRNKSTTAQIRFWLLELRTPELLIEVARSNATLCQSLLSRRPLLLSAGLGDVPDLVRALGDEEAAERELDRLYWLPLRKELEKLRHNR
jgi:hypothetical protein